MLPKVATHILHHTSRAAATVHNYTLRNVIGLQSSTPSSSTSGLGNWNGAGSSNWGGHGAGPGGAKYNSGSRFYNGYTGAGRAVTQANSSTAHDTSSAQNDDSDDLRPMYIRRFHAGPRSRPRSSSLSLGQGRSERAETLGVLRTVQLHHARGRHAFAEIPNSQTNPIASSVEQSSVSDVSPSSRPVLIRRNSTSVRSSDFESLDTPLQRSASPVQLLTSADPAAPQTVLPPTPPPSADEEDSTVFNSDIYNRLKAAKLSRDSNRVVTEVLAFRQSTSFKIGVTEYNMALQALLSSRKSGEPINLMLETYNEMLARKIVPNIRTYKILIIALCERDKEVQRVCSQLQFRMNRRELMGRRETVQHVTDVERFTQLKEEDNFSSALTLFEAAQTLDARKFRTSMNGMIYNYLMRSCSFAANIDAAIRIFAHLERANSVQPDPVCYLHLLSTFVNAGDIDGANDVFEEFRVASREGRVNWPKSEDGNGIEDHSLDTLATATRSGKARGLQLSIWNKMVEGYFRASQPEKAIAILEEMMDSNGGLDFRAADVPPPCPSTYTAFVLGFIRLGDISSALSWFERLLAENTYIAHQLEPSIKPTRPQQQAWNAILEALAEHKMIDVLNGLFRTLVSIANRDRLEVRAIDRVLIFETNLAYLQTGDRLSDEQADRIVTFLLDEVLLFKDDGSVTMGIEGIRQMTERFLSYLADKRQYDRAMTLLEDYVEAHRKYLESSERSKSHESDVVLFQTKGIRKLVMSMTPPLLFRQVDSDSEASFEYVLRFAQVSDTVGLSMGHSVAAHYMHAYYCVKDSNEAFQISPEAWSVFVRAAANLHQPYRGNEPNGYERPNGFEFRGILPFIEDIRNNKVAANPLSIRAMRRLFATVWQEFGKEKALEIFQGLGKDWLERVQAMSILYDQVDRVRPNLPEVDVDKTHAPTAPIHIDIYHGRYIDEWFPHNPSVSIYTAWDRYIAGLEKRIYPAAEVIGRLINAFGRRGDLQKVHQLYRDAQAVLARLDDDKQWQSLGWYAVEDQMIIAMAHAGDMEAANVHRQRILKHGGSPSSDAYGALIHCVKETTDDSSNALTLWEESQAQKVAPNIYLYNTIISKLSKARKADFALELFQQMKANFVRPTSVTYGAVIAACCRVGDIHSAELLFTEMTSQPNFRPRIPPYNTMIQLYTQTKPDRERVLYYYDALLRSNIKPTAHTYKLLLDCYGTIQPVNIASMQEVFDQLVADPNVQLQGVHWASLINAWGCVQKDLDAATKIFDSIKDHHTTQQSGLALPDAITYEAMINVLVTLRRTDLIPAFADRIAESGVHMTAYIANLLIKGYAAAGNLELARTIFEGLADPPLGMAAPNNHVPHNPLKSPTVTPGEPVYREPSTWEAMVRAELGTGNRAEAQALLERVQARQFPQAVYQRISGIMHDETVSPWTTDASLTNSHDAR